MVNTDSIKTMDDLLAFVYTKGAKEKNSTLELKANEEALEDLPTAVLLKQTNNLRLATALRIPDTTVVNESELLRSAEAAFNAKFNEATRMENGQVIVYHGLRYKNNTIEISVRYFRKNKAFGDLSHDVLMHIRGIIPLLTKYVGPS